MNATSINGELNFITQIEEAICGSNYFCVLALYVQKTVGSTDNCTAFEMVVNRYICEIHHKYLNQTVNLKIFSRRLTQRQTKCLAKGVPKQQPFVQDFSSVSP